MSDARIRSTMIDYYYFPLTLIALKPSQPTRLLEMHIHTRKEEFFSGLMDESAEWIVCMGGSKRKAYKESPTTSNFDHAIVEVLQLKS